MLQTLPLEVTSVDRRLLAETLELAAAGGSGVHPDPLVGALLVGADDDDEVVGRGYHRRYGGTHAEPIAIAEAGERARGATLYCNLEPCSYEAAEKRQPPCTRAITAARVARVVIGQVDPHPRVRGDGIRQLRDAGIRVDIAPDPMPFWRANPVFTTVISLGRPFVHVVTSAERPAADPFLWHEDVATCGSWHQLRPESRSILVRCPHDHRPRLPEDRHIDFVDGHPTEAWAGALRSASPDGLRRNRAPAAS